MGSGQSKFYRNNNQYPYPPPPPPIYPGQYNPPYIPQYAPMPAYGPQMYPQQAQGFIPPGVYGQGAQLPPPLLNWLPQDRRKSRRSKRRESERFVGGFAGGAPPQQQRQAPRRARSESRRREPLVQAPVIPQMQPPNSAHDRAPTPFIPTFRRDEDNDDDDEEEEEEEDRPRGSTDHRRSASRQSARYSPPHSINGDFAHVMQPLEPAGRGVFGPSGPRPTSPLSNPLPPPPRDIYEMSPYKALLNMPQTSALLTASYGPHMATVGTEGQMPRPVERKKSLAKSLFRAFSKREKKDLQPQVHFVPVFVQPDQDPNQSQTQPSSTTRTYPTSTAQQAADLFRSMSQTRPGPSGQQVPGTTMPAPAGASQRRVSMARSSHSADNVIPPVPPMPSSPPAVRFSQASPSPYAVFLNQSAHRVVYRNLIFPTATHLYEAMKFIDTRPDITELIRKTPNLHDVYAIVRQNDRVVRPDFGYKQIELLEEVLMLKFRQHADLRMRLLATGDARIIYSQAEDSFWGIGAREEGQNHLGKALVNVRNKLRAESMD